MSKLSFQNKQSRKIVPIVVALFIIAVILFALYQNYINKQILAYTETLTQYEERFSQYYYDDYENSYTILIGKYKEGLDSKDLSLLENCCRELDTLETSVIAASKKKIEKDLDRLANADLSNAYETEINRIKEIEAEIQTMLKAHQFTSITPLLEEWTDIIDNMSFVADNLSIYVNQADISEYPVVRLYLSIHDINENEVPDDLDKEFLYLSEAFSTEPFQAASFKKIADTEPVTLAILADMGHNRSDQDIALIAEGISGFLDILPYNSQNQIELQSISDSFSVIGEFTSDKAALKQSLSSYTSSGNVSLFYDGLMASLERLSPQPGAKCLIVLTDGEDTGSSHSWEDVVALSNKYQIPIYTIGVGKEVSPYILERIGHRTNGSYRNLNDFTTLNKILESIYSKVTNQYKLEYVSTAAPASDNSISLHIAYKHRRYGGICNYSYIPPIAENDNTEITE